MEVVACTLLLPAIGLATWQIVEVWNHGSIFHEKRQTCEVLDDLWWARLLSCMFCLSNWVALVASVLCVLAVTVHVWFCLPVLMFAGARLANLGNDFFYTSCRTPKEESFVSPTVEPEEELKPGFEEGSDFHA